MSLRDDLFVESNQSVDISFSDLKRWKVREKIITNEETHEHPVIYGSLEGGRERERERIEQKNMSTAMWLVVQLTYLQVKWKRQTINARPSMRSSRSKYCNMKTSMLDEDTKLTRYITHTYTHIYTHTHTHMLSQDAVS